MKIALTGASGHLGASLVRELVSRQHVVKVLIREDTRAIRGLPVETVKGDLLSSTDLHQLVENCDAVIHSAGLISINGDKNGLVNKTNVDGTRKVLEAAIEKKIKRFIFISSIHAFRQMPADMTLDESSAVVDQNAFAYDRSKLAGQTLVLAAQSSEMNTVVLHPTALIGPHDYKPSLLGKAIINIYNNRIPAVIDGGFDFCDTRDVSAAIANALTMGTPGQNYLLGGSWYHMKTFASLLSMASQKRISMISLPVVFAKAGLPFVSLYSRILKKEPLYTMESLEALQHGNRMICSDKAKRELQYKTRPLEDTLHDTVVWFRNNGYLK